MAPVARPGIFHRFAKPHGHSAGYFVFKTFSGSIGIGQEIRVRANFQGIRREAKREGRQARDGETTDDAARIHTIVRRKVYCVARFVSKGAALAGFRLGLGTNANRESRCHWMEQSTVAKTAVQKTERIGRNYQRRRPPRSASCRLSWQTDIRNRKPASS